MESLWSLWGSKPSWGSHMPAMFFSAWRSSMFISHVCSVVLTHQLLRYCKNAATCVSSEKIATSASIYIPLPSKSESLFSPLRCIQVSSGLLEFVTLRILLWTEGMITVCGVRSLFSVWWKTYKCNQRIISGQITVIVICMFCVQSK